MLVVLDGLAGVDHGSVAGSELEVVIQSLPFRIALLDGSIHASEGFRKTGFEGGLTLCRFGYQGGELLVTGRFQRGTNLSKFRSETLLRRSILFETRELGFGRQDVCVLRLARFVHRNLHAFEFRIGCFELLFLLRDEFGQFFVRGKCIGVVGI